MFELYRESCLESLGPGVCAREAGSRFWSLESTGADDSRRNTFEISVVYAL